jgi:Endonuclease NucS
VNEKPLQMFEAAKRALAEIGHATHVNDLWQHMERNGHFHFSAKDPARALGVCLDRHSYGARISRVSEAKAFYRSSPNTYALFDWATPEIKALLLEEEEVAEEEIIEELDTSLFWEKDWQRWIFNNLKENQLAALGFGALRFHDSIYQDTHLGHFATKDVGDMDFLLRTSSNDFVVLELKRKGDDETVGQVCRYVGWVKKHLAKGNEKVFGVILAAHISENIRCAIEVVDDKIYYQELILKVEFGENSRRKALK